MYYLKYRMGKNKKKLTNPPQKKPQTRNLLDIELLIRWKNILIFPEVLNKV